VTNHCETWPCGHRSFQWPFNECWKKTGVARSGGGRHGDKQRGGLQKLAILDHEFWEKAEDGPAIDGADDLCEQVAGLLDGDNFSWVKRIQQNNFLTILEFLALVLHKIRETADPARDEKKVIVDWLKTIRKAIGQEQLMGLTPDSRIAISLRNEEGWNWGTSLYYADLFLKQSGTGWSCAQILRSLLLSKKEKAVENALKIDFLKLIALLAADEAYGYDPSKSNHAVSRMQRDLQTVGFELGDDRIRTYLKQAINGDPQGLPMLTIQKVAIGLAIALYAYDRQSPEKSLSKMAKEIQKRAASDFKSQKIRKMLELASLQIPRKPA
jgi:hypothetical protein